MSYPSAPAILGEPPAFPARMVPEPPRERSGSREARLRDEAVLVGRARELETLRAGLASAIGGVPRLFLLAGEPGIGKTRLAYEVAAAARADGARVLWGRCLEGGGAPAYWPWVQIVRDYVEDADVTTLAADLGAGAADIAHIVPAVQERLPGVPPLPAREPEQARFCFFDSLTTFLRNASRRQPLVLVLDDLQAADRPSLLLLEFLASTATGARLLVIATYRDSEVGREHPLFRTLGELAREEWCRRLDLLGLGRADVARYVALTTGIVPPSALVDAVFAETEGNPFFVGELVRLLVAEGRLDHAEDVGSWSFVMPHRVREAVARRLDRLSTECRRVLGLAAVIGREFGLLELRRVSEVPRERLLELLEEATRARLLAREPQVPGRHRFAHALVRDTLYEEIPATERVRLHRRVCGVLEQLYATDFDPHLDELAYHAFEAATGGAADRAVGYAFYAGNRAMRLLAYEDAAGHFERALQAMDLCQSVNDSAHCEVLLALGEALTKAGDATKARAVFLRAATVARKRKSRAQLARAVLGFGGPWSEMGQIDEQHLGLLREALDAVDPGESGLRALLMSRLAREMYFTDRRAEREALSAEALAIAQRVGDRAILAEVVSTHRWVTWGPDDLEGRLAMATEVVRLAEETGHREMALMGRAWRVADLLELGEIARVSSEVEACARLAEEVRQPYYLHLVAVFRATLALLVGRLADAERWACEALAIGRRAQYPDAMQEFLVQMLALRRAQGCLDEVGDEARAWVDENSHMPAWRCGLAYVFAESGREAEARQLFELLAAHDFADLPRDYTWLAAITLLARVACVLRDGPRIARLYELLAPYAGRNVVVADAVISYGSVDTFLGELAGELERWEEAERHFEDAIAFNRRLGARGYLAENQRFYAEMLVARGRAGDHARARHLVDEMVATAEALGMQEVIRAGRRLGEQIGRAPVAALPETGGAYVFRREGDYWTVGGLHGLIRLKDARGLHYLARLLARPGEEVHVLELVRGSLPALPGGSAGPLLDARAKAAYRGRLEELRSELEEAERFNDAGRATALREEMERIGEELAAAVGLGGRDREAASDAERARLTVTKRIKEALAKIRAGDPVLGHLLTTSIKTGYFCLYAPPPDRTLVWSTEPADL
jgi:tetratricopeptide (TPR) repeat protein